VTFREARLSLQVLAEERVGARRYRDAMAARAAEDAAWAAAVGKVN
jgi:hypothetical protein